MEKRQDGIQSIRGLCIIAVVLIHCKALNVLSINMESILYIFYRNAINFPVAVFLFLSGYFSKYNNHKNVCVGGTSWIAKRLKRLVIPYVLWSVFYTVLLDYIIGGRSFSIEAVIEKFLLGNAVNPFYYIIILICCTLLTPLLLFISRKRWRIYCLITVLSLIEIVSYIFQYYGINLFGNIIKYSPVWVLFYFIGILYKTKRIEIKSRRVTLLFVAVCYFLEIIETIVLNMNVNTKIMAFSQLKISGILYSLSLIVFVFQNTDQHTCEVLKYLGDYSYGIFYLHMIFVFVFNKILEPINSFILLQNMTEGSMVLVLSVLTIFVAQSLIRNKKMLNLIGF